MKPGRHQSRKQRCPKGAVVYVESSLTVHNPLFFVHKLWLNKLMRCFYWSLSSKWWECYWTLCTAKTRVLKARTRKELRDRSLFIAGGDHLIFRRTKGGISRNWEPKRGDHWKLWKDSEGGPLKFAWKMKTCGEGGDHESHQMLLGGITSVN